MTTLNKLGLFSILKCWADFLSTLFLICILGGVIIYLYSNRASKYQTEITQLQKNITSLQEEKATLQALNETLEFANRLLKINVRRARVEVLAQTQESLTTTFRFTEFTPDGMVAGTPREITIPGDTLYLDHYIIKFQDDLVETADPLKGRSLCLLRCFFSEKIKPEDGIPVDPEGQRPAIYGTGKMGAMEQMLWRDFWDISNDLHKQELHGIRAAHGDAVYQKLLPGKTYNIELRASGGVSFKPE